MVGRKRFVSNKQSITILREKSDGRALRQLQVGGMVQEAFITETRQAEQGFPAACRALSLLKMKFIYPPSRWDEEERLCGC